MSLQGEVVQLQQHGLEKGSGMQETLQVVPGTQFTGSDLQDARLWSAYPCSWC